MASDSLGSSRWAALRDGTAAIRELLVIVAIAAFLLMPQKVQQFLAQAGIRSVAGVEFDLQTFKDAQSELRLAQTDLRAIQDDLALANRAIADSGPAASSALQTQSFGRGLLDSEPSAGARNGMFLTTVNIQHLKQVLQAAEQKGQQAEQRLQRADRMTRQAIPERVLTSPEALFGHRSANQEPAGSAR
jgi:hypothetical protein